jgi:DNA end-binding protein Ku
MARSIWRGAISFGLVNVPVKLYSAVSKKTVRFNQLHDADGVRIQQKRVCPADGEEVPYENIVKGYEIAPDKYVVITNDELEALDPKKTRTIDIVDFVDLDDIDPLYYEHPYYLVPDTGAAKAYRLLLDALHDTNKVAIARVVLRSKEYLTAIRPAGEVLTMETMLFADELVPSDRLDELPDDDTRATDRELAMARQLIESQATDFDPSKYRDEYRERVLDLIERKAQGEEIATQPDVEEPTEVPDLMAALEASLAAAGGTEPARGRARKPAAKSASNGAPQKAKKPAAKKTAAKKTAAKKTASRARKPKAGARS